MKLTCSEYIVFYAFVNSVCKSFTIFWKSMCVNVLPTCIHVYQVRDWYLPKSEDGTGSVGTVVTDGWDFTRSAWTVVTDGWDYTGSAGAVVTDGCDYTRSAGTVVTDDCESPCGCWEMSSSAKAVRGHIR